MPNDKASRRLRAKLRPIVSWDGEGITVGIEHNYVMLCNNRGNSIEDISCGTLPTKLIFDFLIDNIGTKDTLHISYGFNYDVTMFLKQLSGMKDILCGNKRRETGKSIISYIMHNKTKNGVRIELDGAWYEIFYRPRKQFTLTRFRPGNKWIKQKGKYIKNCDTITIWDVWPFFQGSFVNALREYHIPVDLEKMHAMKMRRGVFAPEQFAEIKEYCVGECTSLEFLYRQALCDFYDADLMPSRHDGPGAIAATLLKRERVKDFLVMEPEPVREPVACAYFGGRIEMARIGDMRNVYGHDIASAYPSIIQSLPALNGEWRNSNDSDATVRLYRVRYRFDRKLPFYPLPYRTPQASVMFAAEGESWVWESEYAAMLAWCERFDQMEHQQLIDVWSYHAPSGKPFAFVPAIYEQRQKWKREGKGAQRALKLALNSCYGKAAQQVGGTFEKPPPYFSLVWAGMTTAGSRAQLLRAALAAKDPSNIVCFMTDGIYSLEPLDMPVWDKSRSPWPCLGEWEGPDVYDRAVFVQAGVYWLHSSKGWKAHYRGFDREALETPDAIIAAWQAGKSSLDVQVNRFVSYGSALMSKDLWPKRGTWQTSTRELNLTGDGVKRVGVFLPLTGSIPLEVRLNVYGELGHLSSPYDAITLRASVADTSQLDEDVDDYRE